MSDEDKEALDTVCTEIGYYLDDLQWDDCADAEAGIRDVLRAAQPLFARLMGEDAPATAKPTAEEAWQALRNSLKDSFRLDDVEAYCAALRRGEEPTP